MMGMKERVEARASAARTTVIKASEAPYETNAISGLFARLPSAPEPVTLLTFCEWTLPAEGVKVLFHLSTKTHTFYPSIEALVAAIEAHIDEQGLYFATAAYGPEKKRSAPNVLLLKALRFDIDAGAEKFAKHPNDAYPTQEDAIVGVVAFATQNELVPTLIVSSGEGLHVYWCMREDVCPAEWRATSLMLNAAARAYGLKVDAGCTADMARVLRPIGTQHKNGKRVAVLHASGVFYDFAGFTAKLSRLASQAEVHVGAASPARPTGINADVLLTDNRDRDAGLIARSCPMLGAFFRGEPQSEPEWRATGGILHFCRDGAKLFHEYSAKDPRYVESEAQGKWDGWTAGPPHCGVSEKCGACPHMGKVNTPVLLGDAAGVIAPGVAAGAENAATVPARSLQRCRPGGCSSCWTRKAS